MAEFRFLVENILTGAIKTQDFPLDEWSYSDTLNRAGALQGSVPLTSSYATEEMLDPWRTALYVERNGRIEWGGVLAPPSLSVGAAALSIDCFGWLGYWDHRIIRNPVGQPEAGGLATYKPSNDVTTTNVFGNPDRSNVWPNLGGGYNPQTGAVSSGTPADVPIYFANFPSATFPALHPVASVTLGVVATGLFAQRALTPVLKIGATNYDGPTFLTQIGAATDCSHTWTTNPATGVAWTSAAVQAFASGNSGGWYTDANAVGFDTVVNQMYLTVSYGAGLSAFFTNTDQFTIFRQLVLDAQSQAKFGLGYDLGIDVTWDAISGVLRDRLEAYRPFNAKNLGEALRELAALDDGFDFAMTYAINTTTDGIDKAIKLFYPRKGRDTGYVFEYERDVTTNILSRGFADPVDFAWVGDGWGSGNDESRLTSPYIDTTLRNVYPPYDAAPAFSSVQEQVTLNTNTAAFFARRNRPQRIPVLRVNPDQYPKWGDAEMGDIVGVRIDDGYGSTGVIPQRMRITGTKVSAANTYDLVLGDPLLDEQ